jgi:hypothetical protein
MTVAATGEFGLIQRITSRLGKARLIDNIQFTAS